MTTTRKEQIRHQCDQLAESTAKLCGFSSWQDHAKKVLTQDEHAEVMALWQTMPGHTCYNDAFRRWLDNLQR